VTEPRIIPPGSVLPPLRPLGDGEQVLTGPTDAPPGEKRPPTPTASASACRKKGGPPSKASQRFHTINDFVDVSMRGLTGAAAQAWIVLWRDTKPNGLAKTAISDIARRMGCSTTTAKRAIRELKAAGLLAVPVLGGLGRGASVYRVVGYVGPVESSSRGPSVTP